ncbi:hypothetical protein LJR074_003705 [Acidovorax sp. LjRoot74]|uniref:hypothetical protein n=1 Tax=Acidovorax sp. LjRoot74 TaxID=3342337 RepID=UPI003ED0FF28
MTTPTALTAIHRAALNLVTEAQRCGVVVTIETTPHQPLAMGNHDMSVSVREARRPPPFAADYSARLGTELLDIVATARAQAKRIIGGTGTLSDRTQDRRDLPETLLVIHHAVQHGLVSLTDSSSTDYAHELQALRKKVATYEARDALGWLPPSALATIEQALRDYYFALDSRQHGGVAADLALNTISQAMGMRWKQGEEAARRAAQLEQQDKAA